MEVLLYLYLLFFSFTYTGFTEPVVSSFCAGVEVTVRADLYLIHLNKRVKLTTLTVSQNTLLSTK